MTESSTQLGTVAEFVMGQAPPGKSCNKDGIGTPFVKAGEFADRFPDICEWTTTPLKHSRRGDVLVCVVGATAGKVNDGIDCAIGRSVAAVRPNNEVLSGNYLYSFLRTKVRQLRSNAQGLAQGVITRDMLGKLDIPLPPLAEQKRIAGILDAADALRAKRREALAQLDTLLQATFLDLFGDPVNGSKYPAEALGSYITFMTTGGRGWADYYRERGARFIRSLDVQMNSISNEEIIFVDPPKNAEAKRTRVQKGDVLLTMTGSRIGRASSVPDSLDGSYISQHVAILRFTNALTPEYVARYLSSERYGQLEIRKWQYGQTKPGLNFDQVRSFQIPVPPLEQQRHFNAVVETVSQQMIAQRAHLTELDALFASLQSRAFRGEL